MAADPPDNDNDGQWTQVAVTLLGMWRDFRNGLTAQAEGNPEAVFQRLSQVLDLAVGWLKTLPLADIRPPSGFMEEAEALWAALESQAGIGSGNAAPLREDPRFADPQWREQPLFAFLHQTYLLFCDQLSRAAQALDSLDPPARARLQFALRVIEDSLSPANFPLTNPLVLAKARETNGESLIRGFGHLLADLRRGQIAHSDPEALHLGEHIAATPGKVVHETPLFQLIQYTPSTARVLKTPLVVFPSWTSRYYIFDLEPDASFVRWAVDRGITTFMVSWKSADESMRAVVWDDYIAAQLDTIAHVRTRLAAPSVHALGYGLGGTTLAATLAVLAKRGEAEVVTSATFLATQVDFAEAGGLGNLVDDAMIAAVGELSPNGYLDGRYLSVLSNLLQPRERIWDHAVRRYLLGEELRPSGVLHWSDDVPNLPARWLKDFLRDLYRDSRLVEPNSLAALGTPIDLTRTETPSYIQASLHPNSWWPQWLEWLCKHDLAEVAARGKRRPGGKGDKAIEDAPGRYVKSR